MPTFRYKAKQSPTKNIEGVIEADNVDNAIQKIIQSGATPIDVTPAGPNKKAAPDVASHPKNTSKLFKTKKAHLKNIVQFTQGMSDLVDAAVPILRALQTVSRQTKKAPFKEVIDEIYVLVRDGGSLSEALAHYPDIFSSLYVNIVRSGELSGQLEVVLKRLAEYLRKEQEARDKIRSSLAYPALILVIGALTVFVLLSFVIPRLSIMFEDIGQALPWPTLVLTNVSAFFANYWWLMMAAVVIAGIYSRQWVSSSKGRHWLDAVKLKIPVIGNFIKTVEIGRFARTLGTLVESGVAITTALDSIWMTLDNTVLRDEIKNVSQDVTQGTSLTAALQHCTFFPETAVSMISIGEEAGRLEGGLYKIADMYERESEETVKTVISLLGPIVLVIIVTIVGFVLLAMLLPIFQMNLLIQ